MKKLMWNFSQQFINNQFYTLSKNLLPRIFRFFNEKALSRIFPIKQFSNGYTNWINISIVHFQNDFNTCEIERNRGKNGEQFFLSCKKWKIKGGFTYLITVCLTPDVMLFSREKTSNTVTRNHWVKKKNKTKHSH